jgi:hypothetical protein
MKCVNLKTSSDALHAGKDATHRKCSATVWLYFIGNCRLVQRPSRMAFFARLRARGCVLQYRSIFVY